MILAMGAVVAALMTTTVYAQQPTTLDRVLQQIEKLNQRVGKLEQDNAQLAEQNKALAEKNDRLEATSDYLRANASATRKELAQDSPKIADADKITKAAEWASRITFKGDVRFRNENIDQEFAVSERNRNRIRARLGAVAKVNDTVTAELQLTTNESLSGGSNGDARSPNVTLTDANSRKKFGIDTAFIQWALNANFRATLGKMRYPFVRPTGALFFDGDINPEGIAFNWQQGANGLFAAAWYFDLAERATAADSNMAGAQLGWRGDVASGTRLTLAASYFAHSAVQGYNAVQDANAAQNNYGNTTSTTRCRPGIATCIASDFDVVQGLAELGLTVAGKPLTLFVDYAKNTSAATNAVAGKKLDTAYAGGVQFGRVSAAKSWEVGYLYQHVENDALYGQWVDSDYGAGNTGSKGSVFRVGYGIGRNFRFNATYFLNDTNIDLPTTITGVGPVRGRNYKRLQLDVLASF